MNLNAAFILKFFLIKCESDNAICRYIYYNLNTCIISAQYLIPFLVLVSFLFVETSWVSISFIGFHPAINSSRHYKLFQYKLYFHVSYSKRLSAYSKPCFTPLCRDTWQTPTTVDRHDSHCQVTTWRHTKRCLHVGQTSPVQYTSLNLKSLTDLLIQGNTLYRSWVIFLNINVPLVSFPLVFLVLQKSLNS